MAMLNTYCKDSNTKAVAPPPPLQMPTHPNLPFFRLRTPSSVVTILAPLAPNGCPKATAPPCRFTFSSPRFSSFKLASATTLKASLISNASISSCFTPACFNAFGIARAGAVVNFDGAFAASPHPKILAIGFRFSSFSFASETRTTAEAPSERGEALGAVMVPPLGTKAGFMDFSFSGFSCIVISGGSWVIRIKNIYLQASGLSRPCQL